MPPIALLILAALFLVLLVACESPTSTPTREPDRPTFAEGEAIAVVQTWLGARSTGDYNCLSLINDPRRGENSWSEAYNGNGQWHVVLDSSVWGHYGWKVFERSRSIGAEPISSDVEPRARRLSAIGCH